MGHIHCLYPLTAQCLHDSPKQRPPVGEIRRSLRKLYVKQYPKMTLIEACKTGNVEVVEELLVERGADPNQADEMNMTALYWASREGHDEVVRVLISAGANINTQNKFNLTPLMLAAYNGHCMLVELLLAKEADPSLIDDDGYTAYDYACLSGHEQVCRQLQASM